MYIHLSIYTIRDIITCVISVDASVDDVLLYVMHFTKLHVPDFLEV